MLKESVMFDKRSDYLYDLPEELIAQQPAEKRDASRLLVVDRSKDSLKHKVFSDLPGYLREGDILVMNDTRVIPARLIGKRPTGGEVELFLLHPVDATTWVCLAKPAKRLKPGGKVLFDGGVEAEILAYGEEGRRTVSFQVPYGEFRAFLDDVGKTPLPPYIQREPEKKDRDRYQTVYAHHDGAVAAPTAGLHFTPELLAGLEEKGIQTARLTLHVGIGTFRPVSVENLEDHVMDRERYIVTTETADQINQARANGGRIVAVGTTSVRTLETITDDKGIVHPGEGEAGLFIRPPYRFKAVDALLTNFHLPGSTLLMLVSALAGRDRILVAYQEAVRQQYRFFSYGDAMFIQ